MSQELDELYQDVILSHGKRPRNFREMPDANRKAHGFNPICGDDLYVMLKFENDRVQDISFQGEACAICKASASIMTETVKSKTTAEVMDIFEQFRQRVTTPGRITLDDESMGDIAAITGVSRFPQRIKCAVLAWHTMTAALRGEDQPVTTE